MGHRSPSVSESIRPYRPADWPALWEFLAPVFRAGETYAFPRDLDRDAARRLWSDPPRRAFVAEDSATGELLGTYYLQPNHLGPGAHVCNCGYIVSTAARGRGVASRLCQHSQEEAIRQGFRAMQFNMVAASNGGAVRLWQKLGFAIVGTLPGAFAHPRLGFVDAYVMFKTLGGC
ncbi:MAG: N-acetyltransferase [Acidobacteriota bacterium]